MRIALIYLLFAGPALGAPRAFVAAALGDEPASERPAEARRGEAVHLYATVERNGTWYTNAPRLRVGGRLVPPKRLRPLEALGDPKVAWALVEPRQHHVDTRAPNFPNPAYSNNVLFGPQHGKWLGYDTLEYQQTELPDTGPVLTLTEARPLDARVRGHDGLGTVRYAVRVTAGDAVWQSPDASATQRGGIAPRVLRVSFRRGDDVPGWLTSYFNVPNVFGSAGQGGHNQAELYQGADCADVLIGAMRKAGRKVDYTSVSGLYGFSEVVSPRLWLDPTGLYAITEKGERGDPTTLHFGTDVRAGDLVAIDYGGLAPTGRTWDHVGMLDTDEGVPGVLDPEDPLFHMGFLGGLERAPLRTHGVVVVQVLRPRATVRRGPR